MRLRLFPILLCTFFLLSACSKDDDDSSSSSGNNNPPNTGNGSFVCVLDGVDFESDPLLVAGASGSTGVFQRTAAGVYIASGDTTGITITVSSLSENTFIAGATFDAVNTVIGNFCFGSVNVNTNGNNGFEGSSTENNGPATCTLTAYDTITGKFSGTFSFEAYDDDLDSTAVVTNGVFMDVEFD